MTSELTRREFLKTGAVMGAAAVVSPAYAGLDERIPVQGQQQPKIKEYRILGRTGMKISDISLGAAYTRDPAVIDYILNCGVNYIDAAERYSNGQIETLVGQIAKTRRKDFFLTTKLALRSTDTEEGLIDRFNKCLERLQTNYVDVLMAHDSRSIELMMLPAFHNAYKKLKADGKARFLGISEHDTTMAEVCNYAIEDGRFDVILLVYNFMQEKAADILKNAAKKNVGTVIMKALAASHPVQVRNITREQRQEMQTETTRRIEQFQKEYSLTQEEFPGAAVRWILQNKDVSTIILSMRSFDTANQYIAASGGAFTKKDADVLNRYSMANNSTYCRHSCGVCQPYCPYGVAVNDILRMESYFANYHEEKIAIQRYAVIDNSPKPLPCSTCPGYCERRCPYGLSVKERLINAHEMLTLG